MTRLIHLALSLLLGAGTALIFLLPIYFTVRWWFGVILLLWLVAVALVVRFLNQSASHQTKTAALSVLTIISGLGFFSILELPAARWAMLVLCTLLVSLLSGLSVPSIGGVSEYKRVRRILMIIWAWNMYAITATAYAVLLFFPEVPWWLVNILVGALFGIVAYMVWQMYFEVLPASYVVWGGLFTLAGMELVWVINTAPFGYFVSGFLTTWIWYAAQLLVRFHFSPIGIVWRKQRWFLLGNGLAGILFLVFFARWL